MDKAKGTVVWKYAEHFNADLVVGAKNIGEKNQEVLGKIFMADYDPGLAGRIRKGDILVGARNFGYGHPHQQSVQSMKRAGIGLVIAESFYPACYRMAFFHALPVLVCKDILKGAEVGHALEVDVVTGKINNLTTGKTIQGEPMPPFLLEVLNAGGLVSWLRKQPVPK
jgi:3-isopropylmalate/(R)-2-methylmalate dehydratase small subunit